MNVMLTPYVEEDCENGPRFYDRYVFGKHDSYPAVTIRKLKNGSCDIFDIFPEALDVPKEQCEVIYKQTFESIDEAKHTLDRLLVQFGCVLLTEDQCEKLSVLL